MLDLLLEAIEPDGSLRVFTTDECAYYVEYENRWAEGNGDLTYQVDGVTVSVLKGLGRLPETVTVTVWGQTYSVDVQEDETGAICVPWYEGA